MAEYVFFFLFCMNPHPSSTVFASPRSQSTVKTPSSRPALNRTLPNWSHTKELPQKLVPPSGPTLFTAHTTTLFAMACPTCTDSHACLQSPSTGSMPLTHPMAVG